MGAGFKFIKLERLFRPDCRRPGCDTDTGANDRSQTMIALQRAELTFQLTMKVASNELAMLSLSSANPALTDLSCGFGCSVLWREYAVYIDGLIRTLSRRLSDGSIARL